MLVTFIFWYLYVILGAYLSTVILILLGRNWGRLPHVYLAVVELFQSFFPVDYPQSEEANDQRDWRQIIDKPSWSRLVRPFPDGPAHFEFLIEKEDKKVKKIPDEYWSISSSLIGSGLNAIAQDELSSAFSSAPSYVESLNGMRMKIGWNTWQKTLFCVGLTFRLLLLFPVRVLLFITSFLWLTACALSTTLFPFKNTTRVWVSIVYARLFCAATGVIAEYCEKRNRPKTSGFAVSSHLTPNDAQVVFADVDVDSDETYVLTGQRHTGIIGAMERTAEKITPTLWLDRANEKERTEFAQLVLQAAKTPSPVLFFPEGYCTNNTQVLQFRRSIFVRDMDIHPIAIRQDARFGDGFWSEDLFKDYILRLLTSWAMVYKVTYLPSQRRREDETASQFASRVQRNIAAVSATHPTVFDGSMWYKKTEREKLLVTQQETIAARLRDMNHLLVPPPMMERIPTGELLSAVDYDQSSSSSSSVCDDLNDNNNDEINIGIEVETMA